MKNSHHTYIPIEPLIGGLRHSRVAAIFSVSPSIEPLIGGLILAHPRSLDIPIPIEPLIGGLIRPCGNEELEMRNEK